MIIVQEIGYVLMELNHQFKTIYMRNLLLKKTYEKRALATLILAMLTSLINFSAQAQQALQVTSKIV